MKSLEELQALRDQMKDQMGIRHDAKDSTYKCDSDDPYAASYLASSAHLPEISVPAGRDS